MSDLVLSLFPGIGLLDRAFEDEGFCIVRGPDLLWGGDIRKFKPPRNVFNGVIGGPPCQAHSTLVYLIKANGHKVAEDLIPEFERIVSEINPQWWLMEMVPKGPIPKGAEDNALLRDFDCGGVTSRLRRFSWKGLDLKLPPVTNVPAPYRAVVRDSREVPVTTEGSGKRKKGLGGKLPHTGKPLTFEEMLLRQGFDSNFLENAPFTMKGKKDVIGNGVPYSMGLTIAKAIKEQRQ